MADDVERLNHFAIGAAQIYLDRHSGSGDRGDIACADKIAQYVHAGTNEQAQIIATLRAKVSELETQLRGATIMFSDTADTIAALRAELATAVEGRDAMRQQGQGEGFAAAIQQLRDMSAQKPLNALTAPAAVLANSLEQSRSVAQSLIKELRP